MKIFFFYDIILINYISYLGVKRKDIMKYLIRKSKMSDYDDIAHIVTLCWQDTYKSSGFGRKLFKKAVLELKKWDVKLC